MFKEKSEGRKMTWLVLVLKSLRGCSIWRALCSVAWRSSKADQWYKICNKFPRWRWWTASPGWRHNITLRWVVQAERHRSKVWYIPHALWHVENSCWEVFHVARRISFIGVAQSLLLELLIKLWLQNAFSQGKKGRKYYPTRTIWLFCLKYR